MIKRLRWVSLVAVAVWVLGGVAVAAASQVTLTILFDNTVYDERLEADWGFAALIEYGERTILFDTGNSGSILLANMETLGVDPETIEIIVLSHIHGDHVNGLFALLDAGISPTVYVPDRFPWWFVERVGERCEVVEVSDPLEIVPGVHSTGELVASPVEQGLVIETARGIVVVTGCAHPGIVRMVERAVEVIDAEIELVVGGFHLLQYGESRVLRVIDQLRALGVGRACPTHCTGDDAIALFAREFGDDYVQGGVGRVIRMLGPLE